MYHGIRSGANRINGRHITVTTFEAQLRYFRENFNVIGLKELCDSSRQTDSPDKSTISLTFDDGFLNNISNALSLLKKYQLPATFFLCSAPVADTGYHHPTDIMDLLRTSSKPEIIEIGQEKFHRQGHALIGPNDVHAYHYLNSLPLATWITTNRQLREQTPVHSLNQNKELYQLVGNDSLKTLNESQLITIGSHAHYHINLTKLTRSELLDQLQKSIEYLQTDNQPVKSLAFPYGMFNDETIEVARQAGFSYLFAGGDVGSQRKKDVYPRVGLLDGSSYAFSMLMINHAFKRFGF